MTRDLHRTILRQLNAAGAQTARGISWQSFKRKEWDRVLAWLDLSGLAIYFLNCLKSSGDLNAVPNWVQEELDSRAEANRRRTHTLLQEFESLIASFEKGHVNYA